MMERYMKRLEKLFLFVSIAVAAQITLVANANAQADLLTRLDMDQDGFISLKEAVKNTDLLKAFGHIDSNEDGKLSQQELVNSGKVAAVPGTKS
jgi:Ca2+-binding EF-hand superfamily protein